ncbi:hypothetical protein [Acinetobacter higginsii]|uniref:hypothetical protein n=1 Tax=Acinetobacter higginsii TaxID=70347 RepID=UPI002674550A|nr:hypothetical protein [Acinetobacter higginsii]MDO3665323.1 hypothetical protein [Acinetobacter higginsii]
MTEFQNLKKQIRDLQIDLNHTGSCTTKGLTQEEIALLDERFFSALKNKNKVIARIKNKPEGFL